MLLRTGALSSASPLVTLLLPHHMPHLWNGFGEERLLPECLMPLPIKASSGLAECSRIQSPRFLHLLPGLMGTASMQTMSLFWLPAFLWLPVLTMKSLHPLSLHPLHVSFSLRLTDVQAKAGLVFISSLCLMLSTGRTVWRLAGWNAGCIPSQFLPLRNYVTFWRWFNLPYSRLSFHSCKL